ncbi:thymidine phosphorylase [Spiroplasma platyhelix]|uniref:Thymidine phosphorylase n=1 Tax=Spiroplasma platyhelix PALS-1 TaxID=1276218 RepID=A0A846U4A4_9MOLU|nr:thymidine phosphorylase [Spiroplasma platyhelix]NKE38287.1 thymidine phosphorylase [Spiroplasma platyhelix PALS-1]
MLDLIHKKKQGLALNEKELEFLVQGITDGSIPDYQITAWAMAVYFQRMSDEELVAFTKAVINSGQTLDLSKIKGIKVDKHSTGGIGDKTSLVFGPLAASLGLKVTKMAGRGLGVTGGTIDKLSTIPNFKYELSVTEFVKDVNKVGFSITSQTGNLVPADKKLYALRDVSDTVNSLELIAASVMSKKIAMGADIILLDVKCGSGAFVSDIKEARELANLMIKIGKAFNKKVIAVISDMNKPLGKTIGNSLEVQEAVASLNNQGPEDLKELSVSLAALALVASNKKLKLKQAKLEAIKMFDSLKPLSVFYDFIVAQGGDLEYIKNINSAKSAKYIIPIKATRDGYLSFTDNYLLGELSNVLGAGRLVKDAKIDPTAGIVLKQVEGDKIKKNQIILELHTNKIKSQHKQFQAMALETFSILAKKPKLKSLIFEIIM